MNWYQLYLEEIRNKKSIDAYIEDKIKFKKPLIKLIRKYAKNKKVIESGSGTGVVSTYLASIGFDVTAIDIDDQMLELAKKISYQYNKKNKPKFENNDVFILDYNNNEFDVSFSNGVLEHFNDEEIICTLSKQMDIADIVIFGIPTKYFNQEEAMYGNERYMDFKKWRSLVKEAHGKIIEEKSMHYMGIIGRIKEYKKWFRPYPYRIFVIKKEKYNG